ncbi:hypothetical protein M427DRAFT_67430 [Gonapodya prolifera JEL478]|uniref:Uncharacterized protein n=1 Tax=Gonapodya prolifera (strain JEL478) TaxID=1344416 RepID=A0A139APZ6_GONPJ|nr:hypothetical protein M427DRAFT_67430 [Gonapodya prolifera JEL478]|eukprot:KXS18798.1 hypothetical protein M427DRAFT_67430 [Gonapodya prolifera JEL478]
MPDAAPAKPAPGRSSFTDERILEETIRKEMRAFRLHDTWNVGPGIMKNLVITSKPQTTNPNLILGRTGSAEKAGPRREGAGAGSGGGNCDGEEGDEDIERGAEKREDDVEDAQYVAWHHCQSLLPRDKYATPATENQRYGWDRAGLLPRSSQARFYHPRIEAEITKFAGKTFLAGGGGGADGGAKKGKK